MARVATALAIAALATGAAAAAAQGSSFRLRTEYLDAPLAIDEPQPRFSWARTHPSRGTTQTAYRISVAQLPAAAVVWDSGRVVGNSSLNIEYGGAALESDADYSFTVTWFDAQGAPSAPATSTFSTALLEGVAGWGVAWVAPAAGDNLLRAEFTLAAAPVRARLYISGLGYYRSYINGRATDAHVMGSFTTFEKRVLYDAWDVTALLSAGCNAPGVALGRGWYSQASIRSGPLSLWALLSVDTADGARAYFGTSLGGGGGSGGRATPLTLTSAPGPVVFDEIYLGEHFDARLIQPGWESCVFSNASAWRPAQPTRDATRNASFNAHLVPIMPDVVIAPLAITEPLNGVFVVDFGRNMAGITTIRATCPDGPRTIRIDYAETLKDDGTIYQVYNYPYPLIMTSNFTCAGTGEEETYTTLFSQYGFQFVQVTNYPPGVPLSLASMTAVTVNSAVGQGSALQSSNALLNSIQLATRYGSLSNLMDVPTDCPQRERRGWLGDGQISCEVVIHNFDAAAFYTKWLRDIADAQFASGRLGDTAPFYSHGGLPSDPAWGAAYPLIVQWCASYYGDSRLVARHYGGVRAYVESLVRQLDARGLLPLNASDGRYGDWCSVSSGRNTSCSFTRVGLSTYYFLKDLEAAAGFAATLGEAADAARFAALAASTANAYTAALWNASAASWEDGFPVSQVVALDLAVLPAASRPGAFAALVSELESGARSGFARAPTGGIVFQKLAYPVLSAGGRMDLALDLLLARGMPSVAYWMDSGVQTTPATTLWERWQSTATELRGWSFNHIMMGGFGSWLYTDVAGLGRVPGSTSWSELNVAPPQVLPPRLNLTAAAATLDTALGPVEVSWRAPGAPPSAFALRARVPAGARATVRVPIGARAPAAVNITESGAPVWRAGAFSPVDGVVAAAAADGYVSFDVGSGDYDFELFAAAEAVS